MALVGLVIQHLTIARIAEGLAVAWHTANDAVLAEGQRVLLSDSARFDGVAVIGVDEHVWRHTRKRARCVTVVIDLTPIRDGGPARLLDMVAGFKTATVKELPSAVAKQAAAYGYTRRRGLNIQLATLSTDHAAPVIARARLRRGNVASAAGAGRLLAQAIGTARAAGASGQVLARADSAYYGWAFVGTALRHRAWFSLTARMDPKVKAAISSIDDSAWTPIKYPEAVFDQEQQRWVSDAEVAEVDYVAFTGRRKHQHVPCRLVVRRVRRLQPLACDGSLQGELFATWRHHAFITNSTLTTVQADLTHRGHAIVEQVIAELKDGPLAHLPSGRYAANAAWVSCAAIAFNIARATAVAARMATARWATLRTRIIHLPARIATTARRLVLHLPTRWPWTTAWQALWNAATGPPGPA